MGGSPTPGSYHQLDMLLWVTSTTTSLEKHSTISSNLRHIVYQNSQDNTHNGSITNSNFFSAVAIAANNTNFLPMVALERYWSIALLH